MDQYGGPIYTKTSSLNISQLVRNLANILGGVQEEIQLAFEDEMELKGNGGFLSLCLTTLTDIL